MLIESCARLFCKLFDAKRICDDFLWAKHSKLNRIELICYKLSSIAPGCITQMISFRKVSHQLARAKTSRKKQTESFPSSKSNCYIKKRKTSLSLIKTNI